MKLKSSLNFWIIVGLAGGLISGIFINHYVTERPDTPVYFFSLLYGLADFMADFFSRLLNMIIVPLVASSIITGMTGIGSARGFGCLGIKTMAYYLTTSLLAICTGLLIVNLVQPGIGADLGLKMSLDAIPAAGGGTLKDLLLRMVPKNLIEAMAKGEILPIIFFSILFGFFITRLGDRKRHALENFFQGFFQVMMKMTRFILLVAPFGIFGFVSRTIGETGFDVLGKLALYMLSVFSSLVIHACITLPLILYLLARVNAFRHVQAMFQALVTAFSTASSSATLPVTIRCVEKNAGVSNRISSFVLPLGATINMDGTALYECVAAVFIAQAYGISLTVTQQFTVVITALLASIGAAGVPMAGLVMIFIILKAVGLPDEGVGLILAVDRILDMCRTAVNVWSDSCGAVVIAHSEREKTGENRDSDLFQEG